MVVMVFGHVFRSRYPTCMSSAYILTKNYSLHKTKNMKEGKFKITAPVLAGSGLYSHLLKTNQQLFLLPDNLKTLKIAEVPSKENLMIKVWIVQQ